MASTLLLLVACANLAGLLGARALDRSREAAVRVAIGAGRLRVARSFLAEAVVLALLGGALSILVAGLGIKGLAALWPDRFLMGSWNVHAAGIGSVGVDGTVLSFAGAAAVMVGLLFGLVPALTASRTDPASALRGSSIPSSGLRQHLSLRSVLVSAEIALALVLLVGAGLLIRSLRELQRVDRGYQPGNLIAFDYAIPRTSALAKNEALFADEYLTRLHALPDVVAAGLGCVPPSGGHCTITGVWRAADQAWDDGFRPWIGVHSVSDGYFETLGIPVLQGRTFTSEDQNGSKAVVVLSNSAVHKLFPDGQAVGNTVAIGGDDPAEVIGVVGDVLYDRPEEATMPESYISHRQDSGGSMVVLRTRGEPFAVIPAARAALADLAPEIPLYNVRTLADLDAASYADTRVLGLLLSAFAGLALLLACTGVWAAVAFSVARRTRELGLRMALGASAHSVIALTVRTGVTLSVAGLLLGLGGAWAVTRLMRGVLYGVQPSDPTAFATSGAVLLGVACLAAWLPARRATRVQPMEALRVE